MSRCILIRSIDMNIEYYNSTHLHRKCFRRCFPLEIGIIAPLLSAMFSLLLSYLILKICRNNVA